MSRWWDAYLNDEQRRGHSDTPSSAPVPASEDIGEMLDELAEAAGDVDHECCRSVPMCEHSQREGDARSEILALVSRLRSQVERLRQQQ